MSKKSRLMRVDPELVNIFNMMKKNGKVESFPEFSRLIATDFKTKKKTLRFFK